MSFAVIVQLDDFPDNIKSGVYTPQAGLVPFHPDAKGLTISDIG